MLHMYHQTLAHITASPVIKHLIRDHFHLPRTVSLLPAMHERGLTQADLVLALLHLRDVHRDICSQCEGFITSLIGHPIHVCPPCLIHYRTNGPARARLDTSPRITFVVPFNPRQPGTTAYLRWPEYKVGRTVAQLKIRGIKNKDLRIAKAKGWIKLEEVA